MSEQPMKQPPTLELTAQYSQLIQEGGLSVFTALLDQSATANQLAERLHIPRARINFILGRMVEDGLVEVEERTSSDRVERTYRASVLKFSVQAGQGSSLAQRLSTGSHAVEELRKSLLRSIALEQPGIAFNMMRARVPQSRVKDYLEKFAQLQAEFDSDPETDDDRWYALVLGLYPDPPEAES